MTLAEPLATIPEFKKFPKLARLHRDMVITEKIDGTNACVVISEEGGAYAVWAQSRKRIITPGDDNMGFAAWVSENIAQLVTLGPGYHYGEWWGKGIQRGYGLDEKRFSLFNPQHYVNQLEGGTLPDNVYGVPILDQSVFEHERIRTVLNALRESGSKAAPGYDKPEGIVVWHTAARTSFKVTLEGDERPKSAPPGVEA